MGGGSAGLPTQVFPGILNSGLHKIPGNEALGNAADPPPKNGIPAQDSVGPARAVRPETPATSGEEDPVALLAAALDAYFVDESSSSGQEVRTVETTEEQGPALVASAGLALGWMGLWRRDGTTLQPSASRGRRRALSPTRKGDG
jgi:hypothetical protein